MRDYELVLIISPQVEDDQVPQVVERVGRFISERGGNLGEVNTWGRRKLAYPIKRQMEANYVVLQAKLEPSLVAELESQLRLSEDFLRHLIVRLN